MAMELVPAPCGARGAPNSFASLIVLLDAEPVFPWRSSALHIWSIFWAKPLSNGGLHQDDLKFTIAPSWNGGFDINIGTHTIHVPKYLSAQNPIVQMVLFAAYHVYWSVYHCPKAFVPKRVLDMVKGSRSSAEGKQASLDNRELGTAGEDGATLDKGARGSVSCEGTHDRKISKLSKKDNGAPGSEPDKTDWQQQQQDTFTGVNHVAGLSGLLDASDCLHPWKGKMETIPINLGENTADSSSVICETDCKIISGLAAEEYLNEQRFMNDDREHRQQRRNSVWANSTTQQKRAGHHGEQEDHSGCCGAEVADEHAISIALKNTGPTTAWLIASAVPHHATGNRDLLSGFAPVQGDLFVKTGDAGAAPMRVVGTGNVVTDAVVLPDVWYVPGLVANVVSVSQLAELDYCVAFFSRGQQCYVRSAEDGVVVGAARAGEDGLFALDFIRVPLGL